MLGLMVPMSQRNEPVRHHRGLKTQDIARLHRLFGEVAREHPAQAANDLEPLLVVHLRFPAKVDRIKPISLHHRFRSGRTPIAVLHECPGDLLVDRVCQLPPTAENLGLSYGQEDTCVLSDRARPSPIGN